MTHYAEGDVVCRGCGLVVEDHMLVADPAHAHEPMQPEPEPCKANVELKSMLLQLDMDHTYDEACAILTEVTSKYSFRGERSRVCTACCVYITAQRHATRQRQGRDAAEVCASLGVDASSFHKTLKAIYALCPRLSCTKTLTEDDTIIRQIQVIPDFDDKHTHRVLRVVKELDSVRRAHKLLLATPPMIVNAVLIFVAADKLGIGLDKRGFLSLGWLSRATLDKHAKALRAAIQIKNIA